jgi:hypothetical protein
VAVVELTAVVVAITSQYSKTPLLLKCA